MKYTVVVVVNFDKLSSNYDKSFSYYYFNLDHYSTIDIIEYTIAEIGCARLSLMRKTIMFIGTIYYIKDEYKGT